MPVRVCEASLVYMLMALSCCECSGLRGALHDVQEGGEHQLGVGLGSLPQQCDEARNEVSLLSSCSADLDLRTA